MSKYYEALPPTAGIRSGLQALAAEGPQDDGGRPIWRNPPTPLWKRGACSMANDALLPQLEKGASDGEKSGSTRSVIPTVGEGSPRTIGISRFARNDKPGRIPGRRMFAAPDPKPVRRRRQ